MESKKILLIQTAFIGDVILATAMLEKLHAVHPSAEIHFLVRKGNESLFIGHPFLDKVLVFDKSSKYKNLVKLIKGIRASRYDYVINVQRFFTTGLITALSNGKTTIGFDKNPLSFFFSKVITHQIGDDHETDRNQSLIAAVTDHGTSKPRLYPTKEDFDKTTTYVADSFICIAPTSVWFTKQYPREEWIKFIDKVPEDYTIYLLGAPDDKEACEDIVSATQHPRVSSLAGRLSLLQSAALMQKAKMNYVNDSAPMHLCSSVNAPVAAVYCSTVPGFGFGPLAEQSFIIESTKDLTCRPCGLHGHRACPEQHFDCAYTIDQQKMLALLRP
jgi:heptosyltransferase-2